MHTLHCVYRYFLQDPDVFDAMSSVSSDEEPDTPLFSYTDAHPSPVGAHTFTNSLAGAGAGAGAGASAGATRSRAAVPVSAAAAGAVTGDVLELGTGDSTAFSLADVSVQAASCPTGVRMLTNLQHYGDPLCCCIVPVV